MTTESKYQLLSLDESYVSDLSNENESTVLGGSWGFNYGCYYPPAPVYYNPPCGTPSPAPNYGGGGISIVNNNTNTVTVNTSSSATYSQSSSGPSKRC